MEDFQQADILEEICIRVKDKPRYVHHQWTEFCFGELLLAAEEEPRGKYVSKGYRCAKA